MGYIKDCIGDYLRGVIKADTRSLEYSSSGVLGPGGFWGSGFRLGVLVSWLRVKGFKV